MKRFTNQFKYALTAVAFVVLAIAFYVFQGGFGSKLEGPVTYVRDGDTIEVSGQAVRLKGVSAPESNEPGGYEAGNFMHKLVIDRVVSCKLTGEKTYDRSVGTCYLDGDDIGEAIIRAGYARDCPRFSGRKYMVAELAARANGKDLSESYDLPTYCRN